LIYQHSDDERQRELAAGLDEMVRVERAKRTRATLRTTTRSPPRADGAVVVHHPPAGLDNKEPPGQ